MLSRRRLIAGSEDGTKDELVSDNEPEPFQEMCSIFRIVALYEMMMHAQWTYTFRFLRNQKTELVVGMYIGAAFELIRLLCVLIIAILLVLMRVSAISPFVTPRIIGNISWISSMNLLAIWTAALLCFLVSLQFAVYQGKSRESIVISTAINFCFSIILIFTVVHLAIWQTHQEVFLKEGLVKELMVAPHTMRNLYLYENRMKCCGIDGPSDYENENIVQYTNPLTNVKESLPLIRDFSFDGTHFYSLPRTCCRPGFRMQEKKCSQRNLTQEEIVEMKGLKEKQLWELMIKFVQRPETGTYYTKGCLTDYVESHYVYVSLLLIFLLIFAIFTALTVGFVIILLLYHDGVGHMISDRKMFGVERNTGVHYLMSFDAISTDFKDDFSLIEFLRKSDIDNFLAGDRLGLGISGRKDAEKM